VVIIARASVVSIGQVSGLTGNAATPRQRLVVSGIQDMQDGADQKGVTGLFPMIPASRARTFGIDQNIGDVLDVADFPFAPRRTSSSGL
jgi:hypothetical protein